MPAWVIIIITKFEDTLAERLRRRPAKPMGSPRVGSKKHHHHHHHHHQFQLFYRSPRFELKQPTLCSSAASNLEVDGILPLRVSRADLYDILYHMILYYIISYYITLGTSPLGALPHFPRLGRGNCLPWEADFAHAKMYPWKHVPLELVFSNFLRIHKTLKIKWKTV